MYYLEQAINNFEVCLKIMNFGNIEFKTIFHAIFFIIMKWKTRMTFVCWWNKTFIGIFKYCKYTHDILKHYKSNRYIVLCHGPQLSLNRRSVILHFSLNKNIRFFHLNKHDLWKKFAAEISFWYMLVMIKTSS